MNQISYIDRCLKVSTAPATSRSCPCKNQLLHGTCVWTPRVAAKCDRHSQSTCTSPVSPLQHAPSAASLTTAQITQLQHSRPPAHRAPDLHSQQARLFAVTTNSHRLFINRAVHWVRRPSCCPEQPHKHWHFLQRAQTQQPAEHVSSACISRPWRQAQTGHRLQGAHCKKLYWQCRCATLRCAALCMGLFDSTVLAHVVCKRRVK